MAQIARPTGIIGGSGMLGRAIAQALIDRGAVSAADLWICNRSGSRAGLEQFTEVTVTTDVAELAAACEIVVLCLPPAALPGLSLSMPDRLVISVMAGVTTDRLEEATGSGRIVRAMTSPAAAIGLAYSPWVATSAVNADDRACVTALFEACGQTDEVGEEAQIDTFTALTGPVPGFVALYAQAMIDYATGAGIAPAIAERAVRQLFFASGAMLAHGADTPADHVEQMIAYAGTTAAGLEEMRRLEIPERIAKGLDAAVRQAREPV
ncbi:pyrroline-5-carboxylate reductase family protein [Hoeflea olei]|uniref:Pyrroline-5-carboxylate reductase n=1 Tax=Hoeflea olei TaxID=1480615 RepID=A0A1C1YVU6_9HYPH|nr:pyrroline-5-carboxylate reductase dimerization domain-containing protein [Hoeflea olei]OCW57658.1 pyrroline-5-carboxylate reductase [Hoeflea olei]